MPCLTPYRGDTSQMLLFKIASCLEAGGGSAVTAAQIIAALGCTPACEGDVVNSFNGQTGDVVLTLGDISTLADGRYVLKAGDTMTGALVHPDGTAALPSITFTGDLDTGFLHPAANTLAFSTAGVSRWQIDPSGNILATTDSVYNLGAIGANRLMDLFLGGTISLSNAMTIRQGTSQGGDALIVARSGVDQWAVGRNSGIGTIQIGPLSFSTDIAVTADATISRSGVGILLLGNAAASTDFDRLQFGGTTAAFSSVKRNGAGLDFRLADDSAYALITSGGLTLSTASLLSITSGANQRAGDVVLVAGTVTTANTTVTANTRVYTSRRTAGGVLGNLTYTIIAATSFTITSDNVADTSTVSYLLIEVP